MLKNGLITVLVLAVAFSGLAFLAGCESDAQSGALIGGLAGAGVGQLAGGDTTGTLIGAGVGVGAGYIIGNEMDKNKDQSQSSSQSQPQSTSQGQADTVVVNVVNSTGSITPVTLKREGQYYIGPKGERYETLPTSEQLRPVYGF